MIDRLSVPSKPQAEPKDFICFPRLNYFLFIPQQEHYHTTLVFLFPRQEQQVFLELQSSESYKN